MRARTTIAATLVLAIAALSLCLLRPGHRQTFASSIPRIFKFSRELGIASRMPSIIVCCFA